MEWCFLSKLNLTLSSKTTALGFTKYKLRVNFLSPSGSQRQIPPVGRQTHFSVPHTHFFPCIPSEMGWLIISLKMRGKNSR